MEYINYYLLVYFKTLFLYKIDNHLNVLGSLRVISILIKKYIVWKLSRIVSKYFWKEINTIYVFILKYDYDMLSFSLFTLLSFFFILTLYWLAINTFLQNSFWSVFVLFTFPSKHPVSLSLCRLFVGFSLLKMFFEDYFCSTILIDRTNYTISTKPQITDKIWISTTCVNVGSNSFSKENFSKKTIVLSFSKLF